MKLRTVDGLVYVDTDLAVGGWDAKSAAAGAVAVAVPVLTALALSSDPKHATAPAATPDPPPKAISPAAGAAKLREIKALPDDTPWKIALRYGASPRRRWWYELRDANPQKAPLPFLRWGWKTLLVGDPILIPAEWPAVPSNVGHMVDGRWHVETVPGPFVTVDEDGFSHRHEGPHRHPMGTDYAEVSGVIGNVGYAASVGDHVEALYTDGKWYPATVTSVPDLGHWIVAWDDGDTTGTHVTATRPIGDPTIARDAAAGDCATRGGQMTENGCVVDGKIVESPPPSPSAKASAPKAPQVSPGGGKTPAAGPSVPKTSPVAAPRAPVAVQAPAASSAMTVPALTTDRALGLAAVVAFAGALGAGVLALRGGKR